MPDFKVSVQFMEAGRKTATPWELLYVAIPSTYASLLSLSEATWLTMPVGHGVVGLWRQHPGHHDNVPPRRGLVSTSAWMATCSEFWVPQDPSSVVLRPWNASLIMPPCQRSSCKLPTLKAMMQSSFKKGSGVSKKYTTS